MTILLLLIPISLLMLAGSIWAFIWAVRKGQFEDMDTPAIDILRDDEHERPRQAPTSASSPDGGAPAGPDPVGPDPARSEHAHAEPAGPASTGDDRAD